MQSIKNNISTFILSFLPITKQIKICYINKALCLKMNIIQAYKIVLVLQNEYKDAIDIDTYYHFFCYHYKDLSSQIIKHFIISYLNEKFQRRLITLNLSGTITKELLEHVDSNINLHVTVDNFISSHFNVMNYSNIKRVTIELPQLTTKEVKYLFDFIVNRKITELSITIEEIDLYVMYDFIQLLKQSELQLTYLKVHLITISIENQRKNKKSISLISVIRSYTHLHTLDLLIEDFQEKNCETYLNVISQLKELECIHIRHKIDFKLSEFLDAINHLRDKLSSLTLHHFINKEMDLTIFDGFNKLQQIQFLTDVDIQSNKNDLLKIPKRVRILLPIEKFNKKYLSLYSYQTNIPFDCSNKKISEKFIEIINNNTLLENITINCGCSKRKCLCTEINSPSVKELSFIGGVSFLKLLPNLPALQILDLQISTKSIKFEQIVNCLNKEALSEFYFNYTGNSDYIIDIEELFLLKDFVNLKCLHFSSIQIRIKCKNYKLFCFDFSQLEELIMFQVKVLNTTKKENYSLDILFEIFQNLYHLKTLSIIACDLMKDDIISLCDKFKEISLLQDLGLENEDEEENSDFDCICPYQKDLQNVRILTLTSTKATEDLSKNIRKTFKNCRINYS